MIFATAFIFTHFALFMYLRAYNSRVCLCWTTRTWNKSCACGRRVWLVNNEFLPYQRHLYRHFWAKQNGIRSHLRRNLLAVCWNMSVFSRLETRANRPRVYNKEIPSNSSLPKMIFGREECAAAQTDDMWDMRDEERFWSFRGNGICDELQLLIPCLVFAHTLFGATGSEY